MSDTTMTREEQLNWSKEKHPENKHNTPCMFHLDKNCGCAKCRGLKELIKGIKKGQKCQKQ